MRTQFGMALAMFGLSVKAQAADEVESVLAHPPVAAMYSCMEHTVGELKELGDDLGTDCLVERLVEIDGRLWTRRYAGEGRRNEDWYGWNEPLLSPCDCEVVELHGNPVQNAPGILGKPPASYMTLRRADGVHFFLAHIQAPAVAVGAHVKAGQVIAKIGNNGYGRSPHVHVGAWKGKTPLQIRWDQHRPSPGP